jgi:hypothetical protein
LKKEIESLRDSIQNSIADWRKTQKSIAPAVEDHLNQQSACDVEKELLGLPSELTEEQRVNLDVLMFVHEEGQLREGAAYDALESVKLVVKSLVSMQDRKKKNDRGVYKNTLSQKQINDTEKRRDLHIARCMAARDALVKLGIAKGDDRDFPVLEVKDTSLKSRTLRRQLGDSGVTDGPIWAQGAISVGAAVSTGVIGTTGNAATTSAGMVMLRRARVQPKQRVPATSSAPRAVNSKKTPRKDGWLWGFKAGKMSAEELRKWTMEGKHPEPYIDRR